MDLSALIFVALAVAWGVYLIPKALAQHEEGAARRTVDTFSDRIRVLARREAVDRRTASLVVTPGKPAPLIDAEPRVPTPAQRRARRAVVATATRRRRRVLGAILFFVVDAVALAYVNVLPWAIVLAPATLLLVWLGLCRVMVTREHRTDARYRQRTDEPETTSAAPQDNQDDDSGDVDVADDAVDDGPITEEIASISVEAAATPLTPTPAPSAAAAEGWEPRPVTLPTYVGKEQATRTVRTIDLDSTGVWTSGFNAADSAIAREADEARAAARPVETEAEKRRAAGS